MLDDRSIVERRGLSSLIHVFSNYENKNKIVSIITKLISPIAEQKCKNL